MDDAYKDMYVSVDKKKYKALLHERDKLVSENEYLRAEVERLNERVSDLWWRAKVPPSKKGI